MTLIPHPGALAAHAAEARTFEAARADRARNDLRLITGDTHPAILNLYRMVGADRVTPAASDLFTGPYAQSSAFEDARDISDDAEGGGKLDYEASFRIDPDGTWKLLDLLRGT